jgi:uncharacterized membrane protein YbhN (UPF0104 family)
VALLYYQVVVEKDFVGFIDSLINYSSQPYFYFLLLLVVLMMPFNWGLEALKWRFLIKKREPIALWTSVKAVFTGISISSMSPNRVGEFFGRVFILRQTGFWEGVVITVLGSYAQTMVTLIFGMNAFALFAYPYFIEKEFLNHAQFMLIYSFLLTALLLFFFIFLRISKMGFIWRKLKAKYKKHLEVLSEYKASELLWVFVLSVFRYLVFSIQYFILLRILGVEISFIHGMALIAIIFFLNTVRPSIALLEIGIRYTIAYSVFLVYYEYANEEVFFTESQLLLASSILWFINIVVPALLGLVFVKDLRFVKAKKKNSDV